jgi:hypothetical protein
MTPACFAASAGTRESIGAAHETCGTREIRKKNSVACSWMKSPIRLLWMPHFVSFVCFVGQKFSRTGKGADGASCLDVFWHVATAADLSCG